MSSSSSSNIGEDHQVDFAVQIEDLPCVTFLLLVSSKKGGEEEGSGTTDTNHDKALPLSNTTMSLSLDKRGLMHYQWKVATESNNCVDDLQAQQQRQLLPAADSDGSKPLLKESGSGGEGGNKSIFSMIKKVNMKLLICYRIL